MRAWEQFAAEISGELGEGTSRKWLENLQIKQFDAGNLYLEANDSFQALWFEEHVRPRALQRLKNENGRPIKIHLSVANKPTEAPKGTTQRKGHTRKPSPQRPLSIQSDALDPHLTLDNILAYDGNLLAVRLLGELISGDTELNTFNPIYLSGGRGCGKSHFLQGVAAGLRQRGLEVFYVRGQSFTEHVVSAIRANKMSEFRDAYRNTDVLVVDDITVLSGKGATQEEFFHTFNTLHLAGKQIILSAPCSPQELDDIEPRLTSRFEWGIVVPLEKQTREQLEKILQAKAELLHCPISKALISFLMDNFGSSATSLVRALETLVLRVHMNHKGGYLPSTAVEVPLAKHLLADLMKKEKRSLLTPERVLETVAEDYEIAIDEILGKAQNREVVTPRKVAMHLCRTCLRMPFKQIGKVFSRDHSTVMSSVRWVDEALGRKEASITPYHQRISKRLRSLEGESTS